MRENERKFGVDFDKMDLDTAHKIQSECDREPEGEKAKASLKEQALHAAMMNTKRKQVEEQTEKPAKIPVPRVEMSPRVVQIDVNAQLSEGKPQSVERIGEKAREQTSSDIIEIQREIELGDFGRIDFAQKPSQRIQIPIREKERKEGEGEE
jgi:hypothetical protein